VKAVDVVVVGGGPAGAASAVFLAARGFQVTLIDRARFPRDKVCGEFISPAADELLSEMGVLSAIENASPVRLKGVSIAAYGERPLKVDYPPERPGGRPMTSLSLPRRVLDGLLVERAREAGVTVLEGHGASDFLIRDGAARGVVGQNEAGARFELPARLVIDAGGRNCLSIRRFGLRIKHRARPGKLALAAHWRGLWGLEPYCYMHIHPPGYTGIAPTGKGEANVVLVVQADDLKGARPGDLYEKAVYGCPARKALLEGARLSEDVRVVDSLAYSVKPPPVDRLLQVGDAMGFMDPFTGEGIYLSLRSAKLAAQAAGRALAKEPCSPGDLARYREKRWREFRLKFILSRALERLIERPRLCRRVVRALASRPVLAEQLVGVIGDYFPARRVVSAGYVTRLLLALVGAGGRSPEAGGARPAVSPEG